MEQMTAYDQYQKIPVKDIEFLKDIVKYTNSETSEMIQLLLNMTSYFDYVSEEYALQVVQEILWQIENARVNYEAYEEVVTPPSYTVNGVRYKE